MIRIDESAPNPQFVRQGWVDLNGTWRFRYDDEDLGLHSRWWDDNFSQESREIVVPFPPESQLSGIGDCSFHPVVWYQRYLSEIPESADERTLLRFGAVDYQALVWINDVPVGSHTGGSSPFSIDLSTAWLRSLENPRLTVRVFDDPIDQEQPRGKQAWTEKHADIWYKRTTGIWQPVWLEFTSEIHIEYARWFFDPETERLRAAIELNRTPSHEVNIVFEVQTADERSVSATITAKSRQASVDIDLSPLGDTGSLSWSPDSPTLLPTLITTSTGDSIQGYVGLRSVSLSKSGFAINGQSHWLRMVLSQGYFPDSHYAAPSAEAIRREVEMTLALGFNGARTHQKAEDPRYLYWADKLGLLIWGEIGAAYTFSDRAIRALALEWTELVRRDINHPSIIAWVPFNESWGVGSVATSSVQQNAVRALFSLTNALDGTRPVIGNDGWEHVSTDVFSLHDYSWDGPELRARYSSGKSNEDVANVYSVADKVAVAAIEHPLNDLPLMITEYGGVSYAPSGSESWYGYGKVTNDEEFVEKYRELTRALHASAEIVGICYTQLTDTEQETNGLLSENREPKIDVTVIRAITLGEEF